MYQKIVSKYSLAVVDVDVVVVADHPTPPPSPRNVLYCTARQNHNQKGLMIMMIMKRE
jgi:hypothetical protein